MVKYREIEFIPADWVERAAFWPGLQVHSRTVSVPVDTGCPQRRKTDRGELTLTTDEIEQLLRVALDPEPEEATLDHVEGLLNAYN